MKLRGHRDVVRQGGSFELQVHLYAGGVATAGMSELIKTGGIFPARPLLLAPHASVTRWKVRCCLGAAQHQTL